jgi:hypothetical protein
MWRPRLAIGPSEGWKCLLKEDGIYCNEVTRSLSKE